MAFSYNQPAAYSTANPMQQQQQQQGMQQFNSFDPQQMQQFMAMQAMLKGGKTPSSSTPATPAKKKYVQRKDRPEISIRLAAQGLDYDYRKFDINKLKFTVPEAKLINPDDPSKGTARRGEVLYNYGTPENCNWKPFKLEGPLEVFKRGVGERDRTEKVDGVERPTGEKQYSTCSYMDKTNEEHVEYMRVLTQVYTAFCRWCYLEPKCGMNSMVDPKTIDFSVYNHDKPCTNVKSLIGPEKDKTPEKNIVVGGQPRLYSKCNPYGEWRCIFTDSSDPPVEIELDVINNSITHGWCLRSYSTYSIQGQGPAASIADRFQSMVVDKLEEKGRTHQQSALIRSRQEQGEQKNLELKDQVALIRANMLQQKKQADDLKKKGSTEDEKSEEDVRPRDSFPSNTNVPTNMSVEPTGRGSFANGPSFSSSSSGSQSYPNPVGQQMPSQTPFQSSSSVSQSYPNPIGQPMPNQTSRGAFYMEDSPPPSTPAVSVSSESGMQVNSFVAGPSTSGTFSFNPQQQEYYARMAVTQQGSQDASIARF